MMAYSNNPADYPAEYPEILKVVERAGLFSVKFPSERLAKTFRLKFYCYLKAVRDSDPMQAKIMSGYSVKVRDTWVEVSPKDTEAEKEALRTALSRDFYVPINEDEL